MSKHRRPEDYADFDSDEKSEPPIKAKYLWAIGVVIAFFAGLGIGQEEAVEKTLTKEQCQK